jgi:predicted acyl esterase
MILNRKQAWQITLTVLVIVIGSAPLLAPAAAQTAEKISRPGVYRGYSEAVYNEWVRISLYVPVRDGTRLAVDVFRPAVNGQPVDDPLPVIWTHHRYHRSNAA